MVKYVQKIKKKSIAFNNIDEFLKAYKKYGIYDYIGNPVVYSVCSDDIYSAAKLKDLKGEIYVVMSSRNIDEISSMIDEKNISQSKYDRINDCLSTNDIYIENNKVIQLLLKVLPNYDLEEELILLGNKYNRYITKDIIESEYLVDTSSHPINLLKAVLGNKFYKAVFKNVRKLYNDKAIRTSMLNHLRTTMDKRFNYSISSDKYDNLAFYSIDDINKLYVSLHIVKSIDMAIEIFRRNKRRTKSEH